MLAERMPGGHVTGIDLWHSRDQSGNTIANAQANLAANGVADRVELVTGDMTALPSRMCHKSVSVGRCEWGSADMRSR